MPRHFASAFGSHIRARSPNRLVHRVALGCHRQMQRRHRQRQLRLRHAYVFYRICRSYRNAQRTRIRQPHILRGQNHHPPRDELRVLSRLQHLRQPVDTRIRVRPAHALDERRYRIVVLVTRAVVFQYRLLQGLLDLDQLHTPLPARSLRPHRQFQRIQSRPCITPAPSYQVRQRLLRQLDIHPAEATLRITQRAPHNFLDLIRRQRLKRI